MLFRYVQKIIRDCHPELVEGYFCFNNEMFRQAQHDTLIILITFWTTLINTQRTNISQFCRNVYINKKAFLVS